MPEQPRQQKLALIIKSDSYEDVVLAFAFAGIAVNSGIGVSMFFTNRGARLVRKGGFEEIEERDLDELGEKYRDRCKEMGFTNLADVLRDLKSKGRLRVYICTRGVKAWDISLEELVPEVDGVMGTATFLLQEVMTASATLTI